MGKIFYIIGKSASGKDSIYRELIGQKDLHLKGVIMYTTRPRREGETEGKEYFFTDADGIAALEKAGKLIEKRTYNTIHGPWTYATADDGQIDLSQGNYLMVGVLSSYICMRDYFGSDVVIPIYIEVVDGERLARALERERKGNLKYTELCRRFLADSEDFSEEKLAAAGIKTRYDNFDFKKCVAEVRKTIKEYDA
ncbi:MAG: guanylate kinase [Lachnospiraceae bacterium]|nr:guanylate kinase [Lachnospiraceae bacterium]